MNVILDTNAFIFLLNEPARLTARAAQAINAARRRYLCSISLLEIALLLRDGRLVIGGQDAATWLGRGMTTPRLSRLDLSAQIALESINLPRHHGDPFDRVIAASSVLTGVPLVTADHILRREYPMVNTIW